MWRGHMDQSPEEGNYRSMPINFPLLAQQLYAEQHRFQNGSSGNILLEEVLKSRRTILSVQGEFFKRCLVEQENATPAMLDVCPLLSNQCYMPFVWPALSETLVQAAWSSHMGLMPTPKGRAPSSHCKKT